MSKRDQIVGCCVLCKRDGQKLRDSHFIPAGVYRILRQEAEEDPLKFNDHGVTQDSKQITAYLMCQDCEQRLNKNGENWFLANCWRESGFRLTKCLEGAEPVAVDLKTKTYYAAAISGIDIRALTYFAASMFWRASVHRWKMAGRVSSGIELGPYEEELRTYLMGDTAFPDHCVLWVSVPDKFTPLTGLTLAPYGWRTDSHRLYKLLVLGVGFHLMVGRAIPAPERMMCFVRGVGNPIYQSDVLEESILNDLARKSKSQPQFLAFVKSNQK